MTYMGGIGHCRFRKCAIGCTDQHARPLLFIFAWPVAYAFLLICHPAWKGDRAFRGSAFALLFWSERRMLHHEGLGGGIVCRIQHFTVPSKT
jgi:uncharacterized protein involved in response to NO